MKCTLWGAAPGENIAIYRHFFNLDHRPGDALIDVRRSCLVSATTNVNWETSASLGYAWELGILVISSGSFERKNFNYSILMHANL